ncbi:MAG: 3-phosphoserine/phosphohydroxythreonine transaminase [Actinomyces urogenitalis]|uniref:3-phosphoserine/phosphohydroxythreonine transaminase n=1 Tax=Actinomyces urogenitalis TaxID=103621 RepID=UPI0024331D56|nr:3-phosphoserine/phosphohydroxythreonine transaminase [Actinomyces urogenitalis]MBS5977918.1 3-phosphoserine/phosphohydroxythreonine transaminase [Actinomyces urogenitalis]MDU7428859.1 3-phosphoserine/phosphohydroxythreonine transaminase [Actinomyces urogenitalis]
MRVHNFSAGPAQLPLPVLEQASAELTNWRGSGMSVLEVSHRGKDFTECAADAEATIRRLAGVSDDYAVLFLAGGATGQFSAIPGNLTQRGDTIAYLNTGQWSKKAIKEATRQGLEVKVVADEADSSYTTTPAPGSFTVPAEAKYLGYCANETIGGVAMPYVPTEEAAGVPIVADVSSMYLSRPIDVTNFGVIFGGAQKNLGPAGMDISIIRRDLMGHARSDVPAIWDWQVMADNDSMLNTPPTFSIYLLGLILHWIEDEGGLEAMAQRNDAKAARLYQAIDSSGFYNNPVEPGSRSAMNVPFTLADSSLDADFLAGASAAGLVNLKGHRSVGGMRASIYNAMTDEGVSALIDYMAEFERTRG